MNSKKVIANMVWRFLERVGAQGVNFLVTLVLARLITPEEYGEVAIVTVVITIMQVFVDSGLGNALIQKKESDEIDFSTVFIANMMICIFAYIVTYAIAPFIADFYKRESLTDVIRVLGITIIISGLKNIQQAYVSKKLLFKKFFVSTSIGTILSAGVGIALAYNGYGIWALVAQQITNTTIDTIVLWITVKWRPRLVFSFSRLKRLFGYGWKLLLSALLETTYNNLRNLVIGKYYSTADLAFYNKGNQFPSIIVSNVNSAIDSVLLPTMADAQNDQHLMKAMVRRSIKTSSFIIWPLMTGLAVCSKGIINILLPQIWEPSAPFVCILSIGYAFWPIHTANLNAIKAMGRSDIFLKLEVIKKIIGVISIIISIHLGVKAIAITFAVTSVLSAFLNAAPNKSLFGYSLGEMLRDLTPELLCSLVMGAAIYTMNLLSLKPVLLLSSQILIGGFVYIFLAKEFKVEAYYYIRKELLKKKERKD